MDWQINQTCLRYSVYNRFDRFDCIACQEWALRRYQNRPAKNRKLLNNIISFAEIWEIVIPYVPMQYFTAYVDRKSVMHQRHLSKSKNVFSHLLFMYVAKKQTGIKPFVRNKRMTLLKYFSSYEKYRQIISNRIVFQFKAIDNSYSDFLLNFWSLWYSFVVLRHHLI